MKLIDRNDPILHIESAPIVWRPGVWDLFLDELHCTMLDHDGMGIAAIQVGSPLQIFIMKDPVTGASTAVCNPHLLNYSRKEISFEEGCLSFPGEEHAVSRPSTIKVSYIDGMTGKRVKRKLSGILARVFLHEYDHLLGITFDEPSAY